MLLRITMPKTEECSYVSAPEVQRRKQTWYLLEKQQATPKSGHTRKSGENTLLPSYCVHRDPGLLAWTRLERELTPYAKACVGHGKGPPVRTMWWETKAEMCVGSRTGLRSIFKNLFIKKEKEKTCRQLGRDDTFLIKKKKIYLCKENYLAGNTSKWEWWLFWVWLMSSFYFYFSYLVYILKVILNYYIMRKEFSKKGNHVFA